MDVVTLSLAKKYANNIASGIKSYSVDGLTLKIVTTSGQTLTMNFPSPKVKDIDITADGYIIFTLEDGTEIRSEEAIPSAKISAQPGNSIFQKADGLYVPAGAVDISEDEGNAIEIRENGLYVAAGGGGGSGSTLSWSNILISRLLWSQNTDKLSEYKWKYQIDVIIPDDGDYIPEVRFGTDEMNDSNFAPYADCNNTGIFIYAKEIPNKDFLLSSASVYKINGKRSDETTVLSFILQKSITNEDYISLNKNDKIELEGRGREGVKTNDVLAFGTKYYNDTVDEESWGGWMILSTYQVTATGGWERQVVDTEGRIWYLAFQGWNACWPSGKDLAIAINQNSIPVTGVAVPHLNDRWDFSKAVLQLNEDKTQVELVNKEV